MSCCGETSCRRSEPIDFVLSDFSSLVYAVMAKQLVKDHGNGTATFRSTRRHEVTDRMRRFIRANPEWVREVLGP